jgi:threonine/homoserine/homoserine lactone efflux protein
MGTMLLVLKSFILGFSVSAPVGSIGLLVIQRTLSRGKLAGFLTGLGAVTANLIYASVAAFGFSAISAILLEKQSFLNMIGAAFLFYIGTKTFFKKPPHKAANLEGESYLAMYLSTFFLMITNPVTIVNFIAMFAGLGFEKSISTQLVPFSLIFGVFLGATCWWLLLSIVVNLIKYKITPHLGLVNRIAGLLIIILGVMSFIK